MKKVILTAALCTAVAMPALANTGYKGAMKKGDRHSHMVEKMMMKMDKNNNGAISMNEHEAFNAMMFSKIDRNNDRVLSREELMDYKHAKKGSWDKDGYNE